MHFSIDRGRRGRCAEEIVISVIAVRLQHATSISAEISE
jgi:hypothetical protein